MQKRNDKILGGEVIYFYSNFLRMPFVFDPRHFHSNMIYISLSSAWRCHTVIQTKLGRDFSFCYFSSSSHKTKWMPWIHWVFTSAWLALSTFSILEHEKVTSCEQLITKYIPIYSLFFKPNNIQGPFPQGGIPAFVPLSSCMDLGRFRFFVIYIKWFASAQGSTK